MFVSLLALPLFEHDMRSVISVHPMLRAGDILLGDRAFCSFAHLALLQARGVFACMRLHQRRKNQISGVNRWKRPPKAAAWMTAAQHALLPAFLDVRIVRYTIERKGYRTRHVWIATTLMDQTLWPDAKIAELYGQRWMIETCFGHLKTTTPCRNYRNAAKPWKAWRRNWPSTWRCITWCVWRCSRRRCARA